MKNFIARILKFEHRKHPRYKLYDGLLIVFDSNSTQGEEIIDISLGGVAFSYRDTGTMLSPVFEIDIKSEDDFHLGRTQVRTVSDVVVAELVNESALIRRASGRFLNLSPVQEFDLRKFLEAHGSAVRPPGA
jgi:c-di-GMP-binding flagellar brake protein YcgR